MFLITKMALLTCGLYLGFAILMEGALLGFVGWKGGVGYSLSFRPWAILFGFFWLAAFAVSYRIILMPMVARFSR